MINSTNKNDPLSLKNDITLLNAEVDIARNDVADGKQVDLSEFQVKVSNFCNTLNANPPPESDTPKILESIEALLNKINNLQNELAELESGNQVEENKVKTKRDIT